MVVIQNIEEFHKSIGKELSSIKDRVRHLIGDKHWGKDGEHKEAILRTIISKFLPTNYSIGTGFVINKDKQVTSQIDIIVYDNSSPVLFKEGDFVIVLANTVRAIIEVRTKIPTLPKLKECIEKSEKNGKMIYSILTNNRILFNGIFSYECGVSLKRLESSLESYYFSLNPTHLFRKVNNISLGEDYFIHLWLDRRPNELKSYELKELSFMYFISNLLTLLDPNQIKGEHDSLFYPFKSKTPYEKFTIVQPE